MVFRATACVSPRPELPSSLSARLNTALLRSLVARLEPFRASTGLGLPNVHSSFGGDNKVARLSESGSTRFSIDQYPSFIT